MLSRSASKAIARTVRAPILSRMGQIRLESGGRPSGGGGQGSPELTGAMVGGALAFMASYAYYNMSGSKAIVDAARVAKTEFNKLSQNIPSTAPETNQAVDWLHSTAAAYATLIPGAKAYVDRTFNDLEAAQKKQGKEVENIIRSTYHELKDETKKGLDPNSAQKAWNVIEKGIKQIGSLAPSSANDVSGKHAQLKEHVGRNLEQLEEMAGEYGPEAKKELEETYSNIKHVLNEGSGIDTLEKIRKLIQDKMDTVEKLGDLAWERGIEQLQPYLDKNPRVKAIIEGHRDSLKQGDLEDLWEKTTEAISSGNPETLQKHVEDQEERQLLKKAKGQAFKDS